MMRFMKKYLLAVIALALVIPGAARGQELMTEQSNLLRARVVEVVRQERRLIPGTQVEATYQVITAQVIDGPQAGMRIELENDRMILKAGDVFFANRFVASDEITYSVQDLERRPQLILFVVLFVCVIVVFGGVQGVRSLVSLAGSLLVIAYILLPGILGGYSPVLLSTGVATIVLCVAIYFTHGFNKESTAAFLGTVLSVVCTGLLASFAISYAHLSGFDSDESVYLNLSTNGTLNISGLLLGSIMIGVLGVLDDVAITQVSVVRELYHTAPHLGKRELYTKAIRVGKEHVGALVNTLALAYTGASLPLLLLFSRGTTSASVALNYEVFATEIIRTIVGSIGLVLTVPVVTILAVYMLAPHQVTDEVN